MFAVIKTGGKQYAVTEGQILFVEKLDQEVGQELDFSEVLIVTNGSPESAAIGQPFVPGATVRASVLEQGRGKKKIVFKYKNKTRYRKKKGHRQPFTKIQILKISA